MGIINDIHSVLTCPFEINPENVRIDSNIIIDLLEEGNRIEVIKRTIDLLDELENLKAIDFEIACNLVNLILSKISSLESKLKIDALVDEYWDWDSHSYSFIDRILDLKKTLEEVIKQLSKTYIYIVLKETLQISIIEEDYYKSTIVGAYQLYEDAKEYVDKQDKDPGYINYYIITTPLY